MLQQGLCVKLRNLTILSLLSVHWRQVTHRSQYKISTICLSSFSGKSPQYIYDLIQSYTPTRKLRSASDTRPFVILRVNTNVFGERSFSYTGPSVWNNLPRSVRHSDSSSSFKTAPTTHLFRKLFLTCQGSSQLFLSLSSVGGESCVCVCVLSLIHI